MDTLSISQPTLQKIKDEYGNMTRSQKKIGAYILKDPSSVIKCSITELCSKTGVKSEASIVRFYRLLGFSGYKEFKIRMAQELAGRTFYHSYADINVDDPPVEVKNKIFTGAISTLIANSEFNDLDVYVAARDLIYQADRIIFLGYAASAALCYYAYFRFIELGLNCHFCSDPHINAAILSYPNPKDLIFCISHSGETRDLIDLIEDMPENNIRKLLITSKENSTLAKMSDVVLVTKSDETSIATDAMNSRVAQLCAIDSLFSIVSLGKGKDAMSHLMAIRKTFLNYKKQ
jgi:RpiR family carbohydrate utilization transcriptional regulator